MTDIVESSQGLRRYITLTRLLDGITTVTFAEQQGKTLLKIHTGADGIVEIAAEMLAGMQAGWSQSLDRLGDLLGDLNGDER